MPPIGDGTAGMMWVSLDQVTPLFQALGPAEISRRMRVGLTNVLSRIAQSAAFLAPSDLGALRASIAFEVLGDDMNLEGRVFSPLAYAPTMEYGRRPGAAMPPEGALLGWMQRHGMDPNLDDERGLRWSIHVKGIVPHPFLRPAFDAVADREASGILADAMFAGLEALGGTVTVERMVI